MVEAHGQTPLRHPVRQRFFALGLYVVGLVFVIAAAPLLALGPRKIGEYIPESWDNVLRYGYYPLLALGLFMAVTILYRVSLPRPLPTHRLVWGAMLATAFFVVATAGLRVYLTIHHPHRLHLRRAGHPDRVPAVRVLPRFRHHDRRRTQRRHRGGVAGPRAALAPVRKRGQQRRAGQLDDQPPVDARAEPELNRRGQPFLSVS